MELNNLSRVRLQHNHNMITEKSINLQVALSNLSIHIFPKTKIDFYFSTGSMYQHSSGIVLIGIESFRRCRCNRKMNIIAAYLICNGRLCIHNDLFVVSFPYCGAGIRSEMYCLFGTRLCCGKRKSNSYVRTVATSTFWMSCLWHLAFFFLLGKPSTSSYTRKSRLFTSESNPEWFHVFALWHNSNFIRFISKHPTIQGSLKAHDISRISSRTGSR